MPTVGDRVEAGTVAGGRHFLDNIDTDCPWLLSRLRVSTAVLPQAGCPGLHGGLPRDPSPGLIAHAGAIGGGPVSAEHLKLCSAANGHLTHKVKEVVGDVQGFSPMRPDGWAPTGFKERSQAIRQESGALACRSESICFAPALVWRYGLIEVVFGIGPASG